MKHIVLGVMLLALLPLQALQAQTVVRTGESVSIASDQQIAGDFYTAASILNISGEVTGDVTAVGVQMTLNGTVGADALVIGGNVDIHGSVGDDLRIIGGEVIIAEPVAGDVFVMGGTVRILSTASIGGDLLIYGGDAEVSGAVGGNVQGRVNSLRIDAPVAGNIDVSTLTLVLGDRADVTGSVQYVSTAVLTRSPNAMVDGDVTRNDPVAPESPNTIKSLAVPFLVLLFSVLVWFMVARGFLQRIVDRALVRTARPSLLGFITFLSAPLIIVILTVSVLGTLVGITAFFAYALAILLSFVSAGAVLGQFIMNFKKGAPKTISLAALFIGVLTVTLCLFIPFVGPVIVLGVFLITLGALIDLVLRPEIT